MRHGVDDQVESTEVREAPDAVEVTVYVRLPPPDVVRIELLIASEVTVTLQAPLGSRKLRHGPADYPG